MDLVNLKFNCRICLKPRKPFKDVYCHVVEGFPDPLVQMVFALFNVQLKTHEAFPQFMCKRCLNRLTQILLFKQEVYRNQKTLFDLFDSSNSNYVEQKFDIRECIPSEYLTGSNQNNTDFELKLEGLSDRIVIKNEPLSIPNLPIAEKLEDSQIYLNNFRPTELRQLSTEYNSTEMARSSCNAKSNNARASKIKCKEIIRKILTTVRRTNNCHSKNYVKNEPDIGDPSNNNVYLQEAFLQNFNLITLQQAQMLQTLKEQSNKTRLKRAPMQNNHIKSNSTRKNRVEKSYINLRSKQIKTRSSLKKLSIKTSDDFMSKSRHLKKVNPQPGKRCPQANGSRKSIENRSNLAKLDPSDLLSKNVCKTDAISKKIIGCETESDLKYLNMSKKHTVNTEFKLEPEGDNCNRKQRKSVIEKTEKIVKFSTAKRLGSAIEIAKPADLHSNLSSNGSRNVAVDAKDICSLTKSKTAGKNKVSTVLRKLRSFRTIEDISEFVPEQKPIARNLRNSSTSKGKYNSFATSLSSCRACNLSAVPKNRNWKSNPYKDIANSCNKEFLSKNYQLESKNCLASNRTTGVLLGNSTIDREQINTIPHKKTNVISELQIPKTRSQNPPLLYMGLINKTFCSADLDLNRASRENYGTLQEEPILNIADGLRCSKTQKISQYYRHGAKCVSKIKKRLPIEYVSPKCSNELKYYHSNCKARIVNIGDDNELQLSLIPGDSSSSYPTGLFSQTVSYLGCTDEMQHGNCYLTIDSKNNIIKLEPEENSDLAS